MLAFELYRKNKDSTTADESERPIKKIIYNQGDWKIETKTKEEYGSEDTSKFSEVQNWLSMPLLTTDPEKLNLPDEGLGTRRSYPYIIIGGKLSKDKSKKLLLTLSIKYASGKKEHVINISTPGKVPKDNKVKVKPRLVGKGYEIKGESIFDLYKKCRIIDSEGVLNNSEYKKIIDKFREYIDTRPPLQNLPKSGPYFDIYLLPSKGKICFNESNNKTPPTPTSSFKDSFDNDSTKWASKPTKHAKFLSYNDKAFTLNCKKEEEFYENLGIGDESLKKIFFPQDQTFTISGFNWLFTDISSKWAKFEDTRKGIYYQLYENWRILAEQSATRSERALLKVICYKQQNAKQEILIDENMTMEKMQRIFHGVKREDIPVGAFEVLIEKTKSGNKGKTVNIWNNYLYAIKHFLAENKIPKNYLLKIFTKILRSKIHGWLGKTNVKEQSQFFSQTEFCIKSLSMQTMNECIMEPSEEFACKVGLISRHYVDFKENIREKSNSLKDILTYSKYDKEKLLFVLRRICMGINLANDTDTSGINKIVEEHYPRYVMNEDEARMDYSYFFYKGYYTKECECKA